MNSIELFNDLHQKKVSRTQLEAILQQAQSENQTAVIYRISKILNAYPQTQYFEVNIEQYPVMQGLAGAMHQGDYREALDDCGRLRKGWKFVKGNVVKVERRGVSHTPKSEEKTCKTCNKKYKFLIYKTQTSNKYRLAFSFADLASENKSVFDFRKTHKGNGYNEFFVINNVTLLEKYKKGTDYLILSKEDFEKKDFYKHLEKQEVEISSKNNPSEESNETEAFLQKYKDIPSLEVILRYAQPLYEDSKINKIGQKRDGEPNIIFWKKASKVRPETNEMIVKFKGITKHPLFSKENHREYVLFRFNKKAEAIFDQWQKILEKNEGKTYKKSEEKNKWHKAGNESRKNC